MIIDKKTRYFPNTDEFITNNKKYFIAGVLSIFLGIFGAHRFYLKRKLSGILFLIVSLSSLMLGEANLAFVIFLITNVEGIFYIIRGVILLKDRNKNETYIGNENLGQMKILNIFKEQKVSIKKDKDMIIKKQEETKTLEIFEVSSIIPSKILNKNKFINNSETDWTKRLIIPYERSVMGVTQVKKETINMFEELCNLIDEDLRSNKNSLKKTINRISRKDGYYDNILYTIYCIAEGHITKAYSRKNDYYNSDFSYDIFESHLGQDLKYKVFDKATELEKNIPFPDKETLEFFKLTKDGLPIEWWDKDGKLRLEMDLTRQELNILNVTPTRNTKVWKVHTVKKEIIDLYLKMWKVISNSFEKDLEWDNDKKKILEKIKYGKYKHFMDYENGKILSSLVKLSENTVREIIPSMQTLNVKKEKANVKRYLPSKVIENINIEINDYKQDITIEGLKNIINEILKSDTKDWKLKVAKILIVSEDVRAEELINYRKDSEFIKIANEIIKNTDDEKLILLCLYGIQIKEDLNRKNIKLLEKIIHQSNISKYDDIVKSKEVLSLEVLDKLLELKEPIRKKINLNMDKIKDSKEELSETIDIINSYIGDSEDVSVIETEAIESITIEEDIKEKFIKEKFIKEQQVEKLEFKYIDFLNLILDSGPISIKEGKNIAMSNGTLLNAFVSKVNQELYEHIEDQTIIIEEDYIKIDDFYIEIVRGLVMNE